MAEREPAAALIPGMTAEKKTRKKDVEGTPENGGQFAGRTRPDDTVKPLAPDTPVAVDLTDGATVFIPPHLMDQFIGVVIDDLGKRCLVVTSEYGNYSLTPCCHASGKGLMDDVTGDGYVGCRSCYEEVSWIHADIIPDRDIIRPA